MPASGFDTGLQLAVVSMCNGMLAEGLISTAPHTRAFPIPALCTVGDDFVSKSFGEAHDVLALASSDRKVIECCA